MVQVDLPSAQVIAARVDALPALPEAVAKLLQLTESDLPDAREIADIAVRDQALAVHILKVANSAVYGFQRKIASLRDAVALLGFREVKALATSLGAFRVFLWASPSRHARFVQFWLHALGTATAARMLAIHLKRKDAAEALSAGILHDLGKLIFYADDHESFERVATQARAQNVDIRVLEEESAGTDHAAIGEALVERWKLPEVFRGAVGHHHEPAQDEQCTLEKLVSWARLAPKLGGIGDAGNDHCVSVRPIGMSLGEGLSMLPQVCEGVQRWCGVLDIKWERNPLFTLEGISRPRLRFHVCQDTTAVRGFLIALQAFGHRVECTGRPLPDIPAVGKEPPQVYLIPEPADYAGLRDRMVAIRRASRGVAHVFVVALPFGSTLESMSLEMEGVVGVTRPVTSLALADAIVQGFGGDLVEVARLIGSSLPA